MATYNTYYLYNQMKDYVIENECKIDIKMSANEWNNQLGTSYSPATFTSAVNAGLLDRGKLRRDRFYYYWLNPSGVEREYIERELQKKTIEWRLEKANKDIENHDNNLAKIQEDYDKELANLNEWLNRKISYENEEYENALALIKETSKE
ncbi:MAG: hypothetical protein IJ283_03835 [Oscillospiraceae bacterium]|nr:hypothetical protein [Oscillospiraceae bacterium]